MKQTKAEIIGILYTQAAKAGLSASETSALLRIERQLHRWAEAQCNGDVTRDEETGQCYRQYGHGTKGPFLTVKTRDLEASALRRLASLMASHPTLSWYHQTDPRGCALYVLRPGDVPPGSSPSSCYHRGLAICF